MSGKNSIQNWVIILGALVVTGLVAVLLPALAGTFSAPTGGGLELELSTVTLPEFLGGVELNSLVIMGIMLVLFVALIAGGGALVAFANVYLDRAAESVKESEEFNQHVSALEEQEKERLQQMRAGRDTHEVPDHRKLGWSVVSTSLITLALVLAATTIVNRSIVPAESSLSLGFMELGLRTLISGTVAVVTLLILAWRMRESKFAQMDELDDGPIPWDSIWILLTGLLVVGIGVGLLVYFNIPG